MTLTLVKPSALQYGDAVRIDGENWVVKAIELDRNDTYDVYLVNGSKETHKVIAESVTLIG
jgi:hypothetical protein